MNRPPKLLTFATVAVATALLAPMHAAAQTDPKFEYAKAEAPPKPDAANAVEWKAQAKAGALLTGGNSQVKSITAGATASRKEGANKLSLEGALAYGRTNLLQAVPETAMPMTVDLQRNPVTTTNNWLAKGRYDRFFTENNSGYVSAQGAGDKIAGKTFFGGGQVGYSRQLFKNDMNLVVAEIGYDFSYESYVQPPPGMSLPSVIVHSARLFAGETLKLSAATGIIASVEALFNLNNEDKALNHLNGQPGVDAFKDTRVNGKAALTTTVVKSLSLAVGFTVKYDQNPAPLPLATLVPSKDMLNTTPFMSTAGVPFAETTDYQLEATLIYTFF
jgi:hypothetical protein